MLARQLAKIVEARPAQGRGRGAREPERDLEVAPEVAEEEHLAGARDGRGGALGLDEIVDAGRLVQAVDPAAELRQLQHENARLKKVVAQLTLDVDILKEINSRKW